MKRATIFFLTVSLIFSCKKDIPNEYHYARFKGKWVYLFTKKWNWTMSYSTASTQFIKYSCEINFDEKFNLHLFRDGKCQDKYQIIDCNESPYGYPSTDGWYDDVVFKDGTRISLVIPNIPYNTPTFDTLILEDFFPYSDSDFEPNIKYKNYFIRK